MIASYLRTATRTLYRNRLYAAINIGGLSMALVVAIIVGLFLKADLEWDRSHTKGASIYQAFVPGPTKWRPNPPFDLEDFEFTPNALGAELMASIPGVRQAVRTAGSIGTLRVDGTVVEMWGQHADAGLFDMFTFPLLAGHSATALRDPQTIVLTQRLARRLFGDVDPMGRTVFLRRDGAGAEFVVTGIAAPIPYASTLQFDWVIPFEHRQAQWSAEPWKVTGWTFLELESPEVAAAVEAWDLGQHLPDQRVALLPLFELRMHPDVGDSGAIVFVVYGILAGLIILVAALNFANLGTSMALVRAREVGVRKAIGAGRWQLAGQFVGEALLMSYLAVLLALPLTQALLPGLNRMLTFPGDFDLRLELDFSPGVIVLLVGIGTIVGLAAGAYPALVQSRQAATQVLRDRPHVGGTGFGRTLVVVQFIVSVTFLATALVVGRQTEHWKDAVDLGYDDEPILMVSTQVDRTGDHTIHPTHQLLERFRREVLRHGLAEAVTGVDDFPGSHSRYRIPVGDGHVGAHQVVAAPHFVQTLGLRLLEGEVFPDDPLVARGTVLINRSLAQSLDGPAIGTVIDDRHQPRIIGVVDDFHANGPSEPVRPTVIAVYPQGELESLLVRLRGDADAATIDGLRRAWDRVAPDVPFTYRPLREHRNFLGGAGFEIILGWLAGFLATISALGIFGLVSFATVRRTREVGVRKALGATAAQIVWLFGAQFTRLVALASVLALPVAWWFSELMLSDTVNRIEFDVLSYGGAALFAVALTWMVAAYHMWTATRIHPAQSLRMD